MSFISALKDLKAKYGQTQNTANPTDPKLPVADPGGTAPDTSKNEFTFIAPDARDIIIDGYPIDATLSEAHDFPAEVTSYPREKGADATDHVRLKPLKITLDCVVSDHPIGGIAQHDTRNKDPGLPSSAIYKRMLNLRDTAKPITISTSLDEYENMVLETLGIPRESGEPLQLHFKATFVQATIIENRRTTVRVATPSGNGPAHLGQLLSKIGSHRIMVWSSGPQSPTYKEDFQRYGGTVVLTESNGTRRYQFVPDALNRSFKNADGWVDKDGYHPFTQTYSPDTGAWVNKQGQITKITYAGATYGDAIDRMNKLTYQQVNGMGPLVPDDPYYKGYGSDGDKLPASDTPAGEKGED